MLEAAKREFKEETGVSPTSPFIALTPIKQKGGKLVHAWAVEGEFDPRTLRSGSYEMEWPPGSGLRAAFPEVDRAEFFDLRTARQKMLASQQDFLGRLEAALRSGAAAGDGIESAPAQSKTGKSPIAPLVA